MAIERATASEWCKNEKYAVRLVAFFVSFVFGRISRRIRNCESSVDGYGNKNIFLQTDLDGVAVKVLREMQLAATVIFSISLSLQSFPKLRRCLRAAVCPTENALCILAFIKRFSIFRFVNAQHTHDDRQWLNEEFGILVNAQAHSTWSHLLWIVYDHRLVATCMRSHKYVFLSTKIEVSKYNWDIICHYSTFSIPFSPFTLYSLLPKSTSRCAFVCVCGARIRSLC